MINKTLTFILGLLKVYFFGGIVSLLLLLYLVLTDSYFVKLDFGFENYKVELQKYFQI